MLLENAREKEDGISTSTKITNDHNEQLDRELNQRKENEKSVESGALVR